MGLFDGRVFSDPDRGLVDLEDALLGQDVVSASPGMDAAVLHHDQEVAVCAGEVEIMEHDQCREPCLP